MNNLKDLIEAEYKGNSAETTYSAEANYLNKERQLFIQENSLRLNHIDDEHNQRIQLIHNIFALSVMWLIMTLLIIVAIGKKQLDLSDSVTITLITTTTIEVLGFFGIVLKYLYNGNNQPKFKNDQIIK